MSIFDCFSKDRCLSCGYLCHHYRDTGSLLTDHNNLLKLLEHYESLNVRPYKIVVIKQESYSSNYQYDSKLRRINVFRNQVEGQNPIAVRYESTPPTKKLLFRKKTIKVKTGSYFCDEKEPIYETVSSTETQTYQEKIIKKNVPVTKTIPGTRIVDTEHDIYNTWSHQMETKTYTERFPITKSVLTFEDQEELITKTRTVPCTKRVQTGFKTVRKEYPIMEEKIINEPYYVEQSTVTPYYYYLIPTGKHCGNCKCDTCTSIFTIISNFFSKIPWPSIQSILFCCPPEYFIDI